MSDSHFQFDVIRDEKDFHALKDDWNALWQRASGRYYQRFDLCLLAWLHVAKPQGRRMQCIVLRENGVLRLVWPLVSYRRVFWTYLLPLSPDAADYTSVLIEDEPRAAAWIERAWRVACERCKADFVHLPYLNEGSALHRAALREAHILGRSRHDSWVAMLRDEPDWNTFSRSCGTMFGKKPGQLERRFAKEGRLAVRVLDPADAQGIAENVRWMLACKRQWSERVNKKGAWLFSPYYQAFLTATLTYQGDGSLARMIVVTLDDAPVAAVIMSHGNPLSNAVIGGFDLRYGRFGPGSIAWEHGMKWAFEHRYDVDFGAGSERFKSYWSRQNHSDAWSMQIANTRWGLIGYRIVRAIRGLLHRDENAAAQTERQPAAALKPSESPADF